MKTFLNLKWFYLNLFTITILLPSFGGTEAGGGLYAQDTQLFDNTWYLQKIVLENGNEYVPIPNVDVPYIALTFNEETPYYFETTICNSFVAELNYDTTVSFTIIHSEESLLICEPEENYSFEGIQVGFFSEGGDHLEDPFLYDISINGNEKTLIITNSRDDIAIYGDQILSTGLYEHTPFSIYPNPVNNTLNIQSENNYLSNASIQVFDISGKLVWFKVIDLVKSNNELNVSHLKSGLYFLTIKNKNGIKQTLKFIKQ